MASNKRLRNTPKLAGIITLATLLLASSAIAVPVERWNRTFGGEGHDYIYSVSQAQDGGFILAGLTWSYGAGKKDAWVIKTDANGSEQWNRTFGGNSSDEALCAQQTADGGFIIAGATTTHEKRNIENSVFGNMDSAIIKAWLIKIDASGSEQWNRTFGEIGIRGANSVRQTRDGGYIMSGIAAPFGEDGSANAWLVKTDANGTMEWNMTFGNTLFGEAKSVRQTSDGGYIMAGYTQSDHDIAWLVKVDANGSEQWNRTLNENKFDESQSVQQTRDGGYIVAGWTAGDDAWLIKTDANGSLQWKKKFGGAGYDFAFSVQQAQDGGYIIGGSTRSYGAGESNAWLISTDANGSEQWNRTFGGIENNGIYSVQEIGNGEYVLAGFTESYGAGGADGWLIKAGGTGYVQPAVTIFPKKTESQKPVSQTPDKKNMPGFEVAIAVLSVVILSLKKKCEWL